MIQSRTAARRVKKKIRIRKKITGTAQRPRLTVFRSGKHGYAQIIDDQTGTTLVAVSTLAKDTKQDLATVKKPTDRYKQLGLLAARKALEKNITNVVFDRNGYLYHGRVRALAEGAREGGLKF